ncbi:MAG: 30S ribosomal protein S8 [Acidimicrobiia bacterium]|nr:30S ribosomal protein S8 [Acidimicrobiia bacterium]
MWSDPIADMLTRLRNANQAMKRTVSMPSSKQKEAIAKLLAAEGYIDSFGIEQDGPGRTLTINLKYTPDRQHVVQGIKRLSKPGRRMYRGSNELPRSQGGLGVVVVSTSQGLLSDSEARRRKLGGELVCEVW